MELWQFLLDLLLTPNHGSLVQWTGRDNEFKVVDMAAVALLWQSQDTAAHDEGVRGGRLALADLKVSLGSCSVVERVEGRADTFKFLIDIQRYIIDHKSSFLSKVKL